MGGSEGEGEETDQMDLERMKNWFCQPNERTHRLLSFLPRSAPCTGVSGCLTDCDGDVNAMVVRPRPSTLRRSVRADGGDGGRQCSRGVHSALKSISGRHAHAEMGGRKWVWIILLSLKLFGPGNFFSIMNE